MNKKEKQKHLQYTQRCQIEALLEVNIPKSEIAKLVGCSLSTLYNEIKRGQVPQMYGHFFRVKHVYSAAAAQRNYDIQQSNKGASLKIVDIDFFSYIENLILNKKFSPSAALNYAKRAGYPTCSVSTLYNYIRQGKFSRLRMVHCPAHCSYRHKKHEKASKNKEYSYRKGRSIEQRNISRSEVGHWEMDTVVGTSTSRSCLLVLTERKTRFELIFKLPSRTVSAVSNALNALEEQCKGKFPRIFKTITCDNGSEFIDPKSLERSCRRKKRRTTIYYCHPYSSFERGTNEINNRLIRRFVPKGNPMEGICETVIEQIANWMNDYPRALLGGKTSREVLSKNLHPSLFQLISSDSALPLC